MSSSETLRSINFSHIHCRGVFKSENISSLFKIKKKYPPPKKTKKKQTKLVTLILVGHLSKAVVSLLTCIRYCGTCCKRRMPAKRQNLALTKSTPAWLRPPIPKMHTSIEAIHDSIHISRVKNV